MLHIFLMVVISLGLHGQHIYPLGMHPLAFTFHEPLKIIAYQKREQFDRRIIFLEDSVGQKFVLKCYDDDHKEEAVCEYLGAFIGTSVGVPVNKVNIVLGGLLLAAINNGTSLATLHTFVPGKELCKWFEVAPHGIILKGGLISEQHLNCLSLSNDLCDIMALDIFLNNKDRHHENCFFDEKNNRYYAIDMGDIFLSIRKIPNHEIAMSVEAYQEILEIICQEQIIACNAYHFLKSLSEQVLTCQQIHSLKRVQSALRKLIWLYSAETIFTMWLAAAKDTFYIYNEYKKWYLKLLLERNIYWVHKVVETINDLVFD